MRSKFGSALPFRPTPATCFPPLPPGVTPGFVPCFNYRWSGLATLKLEVRGERAGVFPPQSTVDAQANMATVTKSPGSIAWTTTLNSTVMTMVEIGIRCQSLSNSDHQIQTMLIGRFRMIDGSTISAKQSWLPQHGVQIATGNNPAKVQWNYANVQGYTNGVWTLFRLYATLSEAAAIPRSRPPNPMIPRLA